MKATCAQRLCLIKICPVSETYPVDRLMLYVWQVDTCASGPLQFLSLEVCYCTGPMYSRI